MKHLLIAVIFYLPVQISFAQVSGNANYRGQLSYSENNIELGIAYNTNLSIQVKGLANLTADTYVAIFSVTQTGKTTEEVNNLIDNRIGQVLTALKNKPGLETYTDMISFVPVYEWDIEKRVFSKKTYNEVPVGFEVKKNIHIKYKNPDRLNEIMALMSGAEIYDLVRVDYTSEKMEAVKAEMVTKAKLLLQEKIKNYKQFIGAKADSGDKRMVEGFHVLYPTEMYKSYQAYSSSALTLKKAATVNQAEKSTTLYYQPVINKEFDFVMNSAILEPVIQVMYEIKFEVIREPEVKTTGKEYYMVTPAGEVRRMDIRQ